MRNLSGMKKLFRLTSLFFSLSLFTAEAARPNFIFVLIDDMGYGDLSCYGNSKVQTTNLDRLAKEGIRFTQFYVASPLCSPSRTALTTGQFPARWRITSYLAARRENEQRGNAQWLDPSAPTLARILQKNGYATGHFGKWHMGGQRDVGDAPLIQAYGFDESLTQFEGLGDRLLPLLEAFDGTPAKKYALGSDQLGHGKITWMERSRVTSGFVERALTFMQAAEKSGRPFYVNVWPDDVHSPFFPPKALRGNGSKRELYLGVVKAMDEQLGPLFDYVRKSPSLRTNTLIIVASDNGPEPGAGSAGAFRGEKGNLYEGGVREPFLTWGPGLLEAQAEGTVNEKTVVGGVDILPSLVKIAELGLPAGIDFDGEDLSQSMLGKAQQKRAKALMWVRPPDRPGPPDRRFPDCSIREGDWKLLMMRDGGHPQLYDLSRDAPEAHNMASEQPEVVRRLSEKLTAWSETLPK
jgi:arylsulfatase A-like enzyme